MEVGFKESKINISTKNYGEVEISISKKDKLGNGYLICTKKNNKVLTGYIDLDFNEIIPFDNMKLADMFNTEYYNDICLGFKLPKCDYLEYYHIKKTDKDKCKIVFVTGAYDDKPLAVRKTDSKNYWLIENIEPRSEYAVYDIKNGKVITTFFDNIEFVDEGEDKYHSIFYQKDIYTDLIEENSDIIDRIDHTVLCGFLDRDGCFSSQLLDQEKEVFYDTRQMGEDTRSNGFNCFIKAVETDYLSKYLEKDSRIDEYITYMYETPNAYNNKIKRKAKVYSFNDRKKV